MIFYLFIFFTQVQTPVTLYGELWSILVVRLAHSANLRSRFGHVSAAQGVPGWSPIQVLTPLDGAWLRWSDGNRYVTATWLCSRMIWAQFSVETNNPAFSRHFLIFDLMECSRMIWAQFSVETNNRSALRQGHWIQSVSTEMLVVVWCSSWKGRDSRKGVLSIYIRTMSVSSWAWSFFFIVHHPTFFCRSERSLRVGLSRFLSQFLTNISGTGESKWRLHAQATSERGKCGRTCSSACWSPSRMHITQIA